MLHFQQFMFWCIGSYQHCQATPQDICFDKPAANPTIVQVLMDLIHLLIHAALFSGTRNQAYTPAYTCHTILRYPSPGMPHKVSVSLSRRQSTQSSARRCHRKGEEAKYCDQLMMMFSRCFKMLTMVELVEEVEQCLVDTSGQHCDQVGRQYIFLNIHECLCRLTLCCHKEIVRMKAGRSLLNLFSKYICRKHIIRKLSFIKDF